MDKRKPRRNPWTVVLVVLVLCCAAAYGLAALIGSARANDSFGSMKTVNIANIQDLQTTSSGFVYYDGSTVSAISSSGKVDWSYLVGSDAGFRVSDYGVAAWSGRTITLINVNTGATIFNGTMAEDVLSAFIGDRYTAILIGEADHSTIVLMENGGKQVNQITLDDVTVVDYGFFSNESLLWVMVCDSNGTVPKCSIQTYRPGKEYLASITDSEQLLYGVMFQSSQLCVVGDTHFKVYDYAGKEDVSKRKLVYGWSLSEFDAGSSDPLMVFVNDAQCMGASDIQDVRLMRSNLDRIVHMPFGCRKVLAVGSTVYGFAGDGHLMILEAQAGIPKAYHLNIAIDEVYGVTRDGVAVVRSGSSIVLVTLV